MYLFKFETHDFWFPIVPVPCHLALHELGLEVHGIQQLLKFSTMGVAFEWTMRNIFMERSHGSGR